MKSLPPDPIQPGDVFVKQFGSREIVHIFLPRTNRSSKNNYMHLHSGRVDTTWVSDRNHLGTYTNGEDYVLVGTVPDWFLDELLNPHLTYIKKERYAC